MSLKRLYELDHKQTKKLITQYHHDVNNYVNILDAEFHKQIREVVTGFSRVTMFWWFKVVAMYHIPSHYKIDDSTLAPVELMQELLVDLWDTPRFRQEAYYLMSFRYKTVSDRLAMRPVIEGLQWSEDVATEGFYTYLADRFVYSREQFEEEL